MTVAFYAPLKSHDHPVPSGDRRMAGLLLKALQSIDPNTEVASRLRAYEGKGDKDAQIAIRDAALAEAHRYVDQGHRPRLWFTYHLYHKAPDWIGPAVSRMLGIPYWVAEASFAPKQADGPWDLGHNAVEHALREADGVIQLNPTDRGCVEPLLKPGASIVNLPPFLDPAPYFRAVRHRDSLRRTVAADHGIPTDRPWLITVAMMRPGDKEASYLLLAEALNQLSDRSFCHLIIGDGPAESNVRNTFQNRSDTYFIGTKDETDIRRYLASADLFVWPGLNEAFGLALLEAQASGLPVISASRPGIAAMIRDEATGLLVHEGDATAFAHAVGHLLDTPVLLTRFGRDALDNIADRHSLDQAAAILRKELGL